MEFPLCGKHCVRYFTQELTHLGPEGIGIRVLMLQIKKKQQQLSLTNLPLKVHGKWQRPDS